MNGLWFRSNKKATPFEKVVDAISSVSELEHTIVIGSDSQPTLKGDICVTVICILSEDPNNDRHFYYHRTLKPKSKSLYDRMLNETMTTVMLAHSLREDISCDLNLELHFDLASTKNGGTFKFTNSLTSIAKGFAFENIEIKPNSWAASSIADKYSKSKRHLRMSI